MAIKDEQESSTLSVTITSQVNGIDTPVLTVNANLNSSLTNFMLNINIINSDVAKQNAPDVQQQLNDYISNQVKSKMTAMGYPVVLT